MGTRQTSSGRSGLVLGTLFLGTFVLGCAELLVVGVLNLISAELEVSVSTAGTLVTAYALGLAVGGPLLTAVTLRLNRRTVLIGAVALCVVGNLIPVLAPDFGLFVAARALTGALHGLFVAASFVVGTAVVPQERMGRAISAIISGFAVSAALGVPLGTLVGQWLGWRGSFTAIVALGVLALIAVVVLVPSVPSAGGGAGSQARHAFAPRVLAVLFLTTLVFASLYATLTYIVPFLEDVTGVSGELISLFLLAYGVATAVGSFLGGRLADRDAARTVTAATLGLVVCLLALYLVGSVAVVVPLVLLAWGLCALGMVPALQYRVVDLAGPGGALAQSLPASAANVGIALGSLAGGLAISDFSATAVVVTGLVIAVIALPVAMATARLERPVTEQGPLAAPTS
jgi:MFS transporter, DHA1 family, inner membrane transport protein